MLLRLDGQGPRYGQITRALSALIQGGTLAPGTRLPPTRELARDLACSRNLVLLAYEQLTIEGYLTARTGAGTFVSADLPASVRRVTARAGRDRTPTPVDLSRQGRRIADVAEHAMAGYEQVRGAGAVEIDFIYGLCEPDARMLTCIHRSLAVALRQAPFGYPDAAGDELLRQQLAFRLKTSRGIARTPGHVLVTSGTQQALEICARLLVAEGDHVVVEDPTYEAVNSTLVAAGARITRMPVDRHGLVVSSLPTDGPPVRVVFVTPSHQFPTGAVMSAARRYSLLAWARRRNAYVFEDDYDSEFRYAGRPIEALAALDPDVVIHCGTFAKSLFPSLRLGHLSLPPALATAAIGCKWLSDRGSPLILQRLVGDLMASGEYDRHVRRMLRRYRRRRDVLVAALERHLGPAVEITGAEAGLHIVARLPDLSSEQVDALIGACRQRGVGVHRREGGVAVYAEPRHDQRGTERRNSLLLGYGLVDVDRIERGVAILTEAYREVTLGVPAHGRS